MSAKLSTSSTLLSEGDNVVKHAHTNKSVAVNLDGDKLGDCCLVCLPGMFLYCV